MKIQKLSISFIFIILIEKVHEKIQIISVKLILILFQFMKDSRYQTIDPIILETLNLNQQRMKHIIEILRGQQQQNFIKTQCKYTNRTLSNNQSLASVSQQRSGLPPILLTSRKSNQKAKDHLGIFTDPRNKGKRVNDSLQFNHTIIANISPERKQKAKSNKNRYEYNPQSQRNMKHQRSAEEDIINLQQQILNLQEDKKRQIMKDYMTNKLKRSKSQEINAKDIYRFQIESIISELTPIEQLQQAEQRMKKLKKKHKHLTTFDKNYYIKLNQHDILFLF